MLMKKFTFNGDYALTLRIRRILCAALLLVGLVGITCYFLLVSGSTLPDFARGFYLGAASGITGCALVLLIRVQYLLTHRRPGKRPTSRNAMNGNRPTGTAPSILQGCSPFSPQLRPCSCCCLSAGRPFTSFLRLLPSTC